MPTNNRIDLAFQRLREARRKGFIAYLTAGDPSLEVSFAAAKSLADAGVDILELGVPFSDPLADGPTIQSAAQRALDAGATVPALLDHLQAFRRHCDVPVVLFTYLNPVYSYGYAKFHYDAIAAGADGILILDLPPDEAARNAELAPAEGLRHIQLIAPTTSPARMPDICRAAEGFIYYVSREGVTGEQTALAGGIEAQVAEIKKHTSLPVAVGFGISTPEQAAEVARQADAVVVGSAIVRHLAEAHAAGQDPVEAVRQFVEPLVQATHTA